MERSFRLIVSCPDQVGIVAAVSDFIAQHGGWITEAHHYSDPESQWFFMRYVVRAASLPFGEERLRALFEPIATRFAMQWYLTDTGINRRVVLLASKQAHCLSDLLYRWRSGELDFDLPCVISNHADLRDYVSWHGIDYRHLPVDPADKAAHFAAVNAAIEEAKADLVVLARYMQILPPDLCARYPGRIINIHHSFLPSFVGARPYHQASARGVKLIGATCHYVTSELDAGPIIDQDVVRVGHHNTVEDMVRLGKDVEKTVLARGLRYHLEDRVLLYGNKTIVFA
jgi:formyltetrahydrofolate deformylase